MRGSADDSRQSHGVTEVTERSDRTSDHRDLVVEHPLDENRHAAIAVRIALLKAELAEHISRNGPADRVAAVQRGGGEFEDRRSPTPVQLRHELPVPLLAVLAEREGEHASVIQVPRCEQRIRIHNDHRIGARSHRPRRFVQRNERPTIERSCNGHGNAAADRRARCGINVRVATKEMALRRDGVCSDCATSLPAGTRAQWDSAAKHVTCLQCVDSVAPPATDPPTSATIPDAPPVPAPPPEPVVPLVDPPPIDTGTPGTSARKEFERRHAKRERQIEETWGTGRLGRIAKFLSDDPQTTTAWAKGAHGEVRVGEILGKRLAEDAVLLHDRKVPKTRGNIDHLAIASSGVWIIDAKKYAGKVEKRDVGGFFKTDLRLYVGGRDRTKSVDGLQWQVDAVRAVLDDDAIPVHPALSFVDAQWPIFAKPLQLKGVWISWPAKLADLVLRDGPLSVDDVERISRLLAHRLPAH